VAAPSASALQEQQAPSAAPTTPATVLSPDRVIVQWLPGADHGDKVDARSEADVSFQADLGKREFQLVEVEPGQAPGAAVRELEADPAVAVAERDGYTAPMAIPNDPLFGELWGLRNAGAGIGGFDGAVASSDIAAAAAWDRAVGTPSTVIADIDTGYRFEHPDLAGVAWTNPNEVANGLDDDGDGIVDDLHGADFVGDNGEEPAIDGNPTDSDLLSGGHGVHTAGTIGASGNNGIGITGVARNARIMPLRVCSRFPALADSRCPVASQIAAINYAGAHGARVANMSLGGTSFSQAQVNAIAQNPQVLFVISAGNDGVNNDSVHHYPCDYTPQTQASPPVSGSIDNIICVAATNQADSLASFSDWGPTSVDLGAPGTETLSTYPYETPVADSFTANDFMAKWPATGADGGFQRTNESPLASFGMTDVVGAPTANSVRETTTAPVAVPANGGCKLNQTRRVVLSGTDHYRYSVLLNGVEQSGAISEPSSTVEPGLDRRFLELPAPFKAGGTVRIRFRFTSGASPAAGDGVWLDDISLVCSQVVGQAHGYGLLQGTSMAAPHVTGAAGLLFSLEPGATVTQVREALLSSVDPNPALSGLTTTGGRLDARAALDALVPPGAETEPPETALSSGPPSSTISTTASFGFSRVDADGGSFECRLNQAPTWSPCSSPFSLTTGIGTQRFEVRAKSESGLVDPTPAFSVWTVFPIPSPVPPVPSPRADCTVPKLAGKSLAQAKTALKSAGCTLGKVTKAKAKAKKGHKLPALVVKSSTPRTGTVATGTVALTLGPKPKKHRH
jgi:subtilisin family serine protease